MNREELAWSAGFFDGEGCTMLRRDRRPNDPTRKPTLNVGIAINQIDRRVLDRFLEAVGTGTIRGPYKTPGGRDQWRYVADGHARVTAVVAFLWPWLGEVKREQARRVLGDYLDDRAERAA